MLLVILLNRSRFVYSVLHSLLSLFAFKHSKTSFEKKLFFCVGEYAEYGFDQQG